MQHTKKFFFTKRQDTIFFAKKNTATKQTACTYANRPAQQTKLCTTAPWENQHDDKTKSSAMNKYRVQKKTPRQNKRLALTQTAQHHKQSFVQLPLGKTNTTTKQNDTHDPRTACKNPPHDKTNGLHLRKPPRTKT